MPTWLTAERYFLVALVFLLVAAFGVHLDGQFVWDDVPLIAENNALQSFSAVRDLLVHDLWGQATGRSTQLYHPIPMLSIWLQVQLSGLSLPALRLGNIAIHGSVIWLFFLWLRKFGLSAWPAALACTVVAIHPSVTEPVMWITGRHDSLGALFTMAALLTVPGSKEQAGVGPAIWTATASASAFLCKEPYLVAAALTAFAVATRIKRERHRRRTIAVVQIALPFVAIAVVATWRAMLGISLGAAQARRSLAEHLGNYAAVTLHYAKQLLTFSNGSTIEPFHPIGLAAQATVWAVLLIVTSGLVFGWIRKRSSFWLPLFGWSWFLISLAPHIISVPSIGLYGNRYAYLGLFGLAAAIVSLLTTMCEAGPPRARYYLAALALAVSLIILPRTTRAASAFHDNIRLYQFDVTKNPTNGYALYHLATAVTKQLGCAHSVDMFKQAAHLAPEYDRPWHNAAGCLIRLGKPALARPYAQRAVELAPGNATRHFNLALSLLAEGKLAQGRVHLRQALRLQPDYQSARKVLESLPP